MIICRVCNASMPLGALHPLSGARSLRMETTGPYLGKAGSSLSHVFCYAPDVCWDLPEQLLHEVQSQSFSIEMLSRMVLLYPMGFPASITQSPSFRTVCAPSFLISDCLLFIPCYLFCRELGATSKFNYRNQYSVSLLSLVLTIPWYLLPECWSSILVGTGHHWEVQGHGVRIVGFRFKWAVFKSQLCGLQ